MAYNTLSSEFYHLDPTFSPDLEVAFFSYFIENGAPGPWLEAMCGSGRILIPLLKKGLIVEGVDNSPSMLELCKRDMAKAQVATSLYEQSITELALAKKYRGIIICFASFQLLDRDNALRALHTLKNNLLPGGMLLIDLFVPWESIRKCVVNGSLAAHKKIDDLPVQKLHASDGFILERSAVIDIYPQEQYIISTNKYKKIDAKGLELETENEKIKLMWYYRYEFIYVLNEAGFKTVNIIDQTDEMVTYQAFID